MANASDSHRELARDARARCAVLTVSDSRGAENDSSGDLIVGKLEGSGHAVVERDWVRDEPAEIARVLTGWQSRSEIDLVVTTGGTGVSRRDTTVEVVERFLEKRLDGFGELFRALSFAEIGSPAMLSRAVAGLARNQLVFALPGSPAAVELALDRLILPELPHLVWERGR